MQNRKYKLEVDLIMRPLTEPICEGFEAETLKTLEMTLVNCIKLVDAHVTES